MNLGLGPEVFNQPELCYGMRDRRENESPPRKNLSPLGKRKAQSDVGGRRQKFTQLRRMGHLRQAHPDWYDSNGIYCGPSDLPGVGVVRALPMSKLTEREQAIQQSHSDSLKPIHYETTLFTGETVGEFTLNYLKNLDRNTKAATSSKMYGIDLSSRTDEVIEKAHVVTIENVDDNTTEEFTQEAVEGLTIHELVSELSKECRQVAQTVYETDWTSGVLQGKDIRLKIVTNRRSRQGLTVYIRQTEEEG